MIAGLLVMIAMQVPPKPGMTQFPATMGTAIVARDTMSQVDEPKQVVARTAAEWAALWRQHAGESPAPNVDLGTRTIVAIFLGTRPSAGYAVDITGTQESKGVLTVSWRERRPDPGDITAQVLTTPMAIASLPKFAGEIRFVRADK
jgi:hypothetical protein